MRVILLTDVKKVGQRGSLVEVADGYAQNVLLPKKLALPVTPEHIARLEKAQEAAAEKAALAHTLLAKNLQSLDGKTISIAVNAHESGTLFEQLKPKLILKEIEKTFSVTVPESAVTLETIKKVGEYTLTFSTDNVTSRLTLSVSAVVKRPT